MSKIDEFEYWFGKDAQDFKRLLSYSKLRQLMDRRKGALRINCYKATQRERKIKHKG